MRADFVERAGAVVRRARADSAAGASRRSVSGLDAFLDEIAQGAWFAGCGEPLVDSERADAAAYPMALGLGSLPVVSVALWPEAARVTRRPDWSRSWWEGSAPPKQIFARPRQPLAASPGFLRGSAAWRGRRQRSTAPPRSRPNAAASPIRRFPAWPRARRPSLHQAALAAAAAAGSGHAFGSSSACSPPAAGRWAFLANAATSFETGR